ncbi:MAG: hypothetical protein M3164_07180 [Actinomycetota bacterium]|nr:hypothetical protein [Actinomycetota bacterium]
MARSLTPLIFAGLVVGALLATFLIMARASKGYDRARKRRMSAGVTIPCSACGSSMTLVGIQEFMVGPGGMPADREVAEALGAAEGVLPLEIHRCPTCRRIELFLPPAAG